MATIEEILGPKPKTVESILGPRPTGVVEPPPFDVDGFVSSVGEERGFPVDATERDGLSRTLGHITRPFLAQGYNAYSALNRGNASFYDGLDLVADFIAKRTGTEKGGLFEKMAKVSLEKADHWQKRAQTVGVNFVDELISDAIGGFAPGVAGFSLDVGSLFTLPAMRGFARAEKTGDNPFVSALLEAAQTKTLHMMFKSLAPLKKYLSAPMMGTIFGVQEAAVVPEGEGAKGFAKGFGTGVGYSVFSPGGQMGLGELIRDARIQKAMIPEARIPDSEVIKNDPSIEKIIREKERFVEPNKWENQEYFKRTLQQFEREGEPSLVNAEWENVTVPIDSLRDNNKSLFAGKWTLGEKSKTEGPVILDHSGKIIDGNHRISEALKRGETEVSVLRPKVGGFEEIVPSRPLADQFAPPGPPETRPREYWKTVEGTERTAPEAKDLMGEIQAEEPKVNIVQSNRVNLEKAYDILEKKGPEETLRLTEEGKGMTPVEKGALYNVLMERAQKEGDWAKFVDIMDNYSLYLVDLGRGVQIASVWSKSTPMGFLKWAEKQLDATNKKIGWIDTLFGRQKAKLTEQEKISMSQEFMRIQKMPEGKEKSNDMLRLIDQVAVKVPPFVSEYIDAYRYQNMLSGPQTQERNILWNMTNTFVLRPYDLAWSGVIDYLGAGLRGKERRAYISDAPAYLRDAVNSIPTALTAFKASWKQDLGEIIAKPDLGVDYKTPFEAARTKQLPRALTVVQRFMEASDKFNSVLIASGEKARLMNHGMGELKAEVQAKALAEKYLVRDKLDPLDPTISYASKALEGLGTIIQFGRKTRYGGKLLSWVVPFLRTPIKVGVQMIERSPLGWARGNLDLESSSKLVGGAMATGLGALFAYTGETTWSVPTSPEEKEWFFATGRKPYSFKIGEKWIPAWYLGPMALAFMFPAAVKYYTEQSKESMTDDMLDKIGEISGGVAKFIANQTSVQSIGNFFSFMAGDIDYNVKNQVGFTIGQFIPLGAMVRYINKALDPVYRKAEGIYEQTVKNIPGLSEDLPARTKPFMEESRRDYFNLFLPYDVGVEDPTYEALMPMKKMEARQKYLDNKMDQLMKKMEEGDFRDKHFDEMIKIMNAAPKVYE